METTQTGHLHVVDSRTKKEYEVPILGNHIQAKDLAAITAPNPEDDGAPQMLTVLDNGFENTACMESEITHMCVCFPLPDPATVTDPLLLLSSDGYRGTIEYRGIPIEDLFRDNDFEDVLHLLLWSKLPTLSEKKAVRAAISAAQNPPKSVINTISAFP